jgi:hypothetical protein
MKIAKDAFEYLESLTLAELLDEIDNEEAKLAELLERKQLIEYRITRFKNDLYFRRDDK